jgi:hypothetical protein
MHKSTFGEPFEIRHSKLDGNEVITAVLPRPNERDGLYFEFLFVSRAASCAHFSGEVLPPE